MTRIPITTPIIPEIQINASSVNRIEDKDQKLRESRRSIAQDKEQIDPIITIIDAKESKDAKDEKENKEDKREMSHSDMITIPHSLLKDLLQRFLCPIAQTVMRHPVIAEDGYTYERESIEEWFRSRAHLVIRSPMTNANMGTSLRESKTTKETIDFFLEKFPDGTREELFNAIIQKNIKDVSYQLFLRSPVNECDSDGRSALHLTAELDDKVAGTAIVRELLDFKADPNLKDKNQCTPLMYACTRKNRWIVPLLIPKTKIKIRNGKGQTAMHLAVEDTEIIEMLLNADADVDTQDDEGITPLMQACIQDQYLSVEHLLSHWKDIWTLAQRRAGNSSRLAYNPDDEANTALRDKKGWHALHHAANAGADKSIEVLMKCIQAKSTIKDSFLSIFSKTDPTLELKDTDGNTPLAIAALAGKKATVKLLIEKYKADEKTTNLKQETLLHLAAKSNLETVKFLADRSPANLSAPDVNGLIPLMTAITHEIKKESKLENIKIISFLVNISDLNARDLNGNTIMHLAVISKRRDVVDWLFESYQNKMMYAPGIGLSLPVIISKIENLQSLSTVKKTDKYTDEINLLMQGLSQIRLNLRNKKNFSPLLLAAKLGQVELVRKFMDFEISQPLTRQNDYRIEHTELFLLLTRSKQHELLIAILYEYPLHFQSNPKKTTGMIDINIHDEAGDTALHTAARCDDWKLIWILLWMNIDIAHVNNLKKVARELTSAPDHFDFLVKYVNEQKQTHGSHFPTLLSKVKLPTIFAAIGKKEPGTIAQTAPSAISQQEAKETVTVSQAALQLTHEPKPSDLQVAPTLGLEGYMSQMVSRIGLV